jgi:PhoH-like ATPase
MKKIYVLDTSVCLTSANSLYSFKNNDIIIPIKVLEEVDGHKKRQDVVGSNARQTIRILDSLRQKGSLSDGVRLGRGKGVIKVINSVFSDIMPPEMSKEAADNKIISCALKLTHIEQDKKVILVSRDINMRVIANSLGIVAEDFEGEHVLDDGSKLYTGTHDLLIDDEVVDRFYKGEEIYLDKNQNKGLFANQFVKLISNSNEKKTALSRFTHEQAPLLQIKNAKTMWGVTPRNTEQRYALELLMDPSVPVVSLVGRAGSGKSLLALVGGLEQVIGRENRYTRLIVSKPVHSVGKDIGFLPGTLEEKMLPWLKPIQDNLQFLMGNDKGMMQDYMDKGVIEVEAISYIRGRSIANTYMIIEECQNLTQHEIKTIITRVGENTKIVLTGDVEQIDNAYIDETSNGLSNVVEKFKTSLLAGHVLMQKGERSLVATLASEVL